MFVNKLIRSGLKSCCCHLNPKVYFLDCSCMTSVASILSLFISYEISCLREFCLSKKCSLNVTFHFHCPQRDHEKVLMKNWFVFFKLAEINHKETNIAKNDTRQEKKRRFYCFSANFS